jgi:peptidyl-prolyl cis-trans isomerase B (cyclophilin B)
LDVLDAIAKVPTDTLDVPLAPVTLDVNVISLTGKQLKEYGWELK